MKKLIISSLVLLSLSVASAQDSSIEPGTICKPVTKSKVQFYSFEGGNTNVWLKEYTRATIKQRGFSTKVAYRSGATDIELALDLSKRVLTGHVTDERGTEIVNTFVRCR